MSSRADRGIKNGLLDEGEAGFDAGHVRLVDEGGLRHFAFQLRALAGEQVSAAALRAHEFSGGGDSEPLGHGLAGFAAGDGFWHEKGVRS